MCRIFLLWKFVRIDPRTLHIAPTSMISSLLAITMLIEYWFCATKVGCCGCVVSQTTTAWRPCNHRDLAVARVHLPTPRLQGFMAVIYPAVARVHGCYLSSSCKGSWLATRLEMLQRSTMVSQNYSKCSNWVGTVYPDKIDQLKGLGLGASNHWTGIWKGKWNEQLQLHKSCNWHCWIYHSIPHIPVTGTVEFTIPFHTFQSSDEDLLLTTLWVQFRSVPQQSFVVSLSACPL